MSETKQQQFYSVGLGSLNGKDHVVLTVHGEHGAECSLMLTAEGIDTLIALLKTAASGVEGGCV